MKKPDIARHLPLNPVHYRMLLVLLDGASYGTRIVESIEQREAEWRKLYPANLYRRVRELLQKGLIAECSGPEDADPRRSYVCMTDLGREVAIAESRRLQELVWDAERCGLLDRPAR